MVGKTELQLFHQHMHVQPYYPIKYLKKPPLIHILLHLYFRITKKKINGKKHKVSEKANLLSSKVPKFLSSQSLTSSTSSSSSTYPLLSSKKNINGKRKTGSENNTRKKAKVTTSSPSSS